MVPPRQAADYGFKKIASVEDLARHHPEEYPFNTYDKKCVHCNIQVPRLSIQQLIYRCALLCRMPAFHDEPIEAIIVMHDPTDWAPELQIAVDVLIGGLPPGSGTVSGKQTPLFVSNDDFIFSGAYPFPRFAQGSLDGLVQYLVVWPSLSRICVMQAPSLDASGCCTSS